MSFCFLFEKWIIGIMTLLLLPCPTSIFAREMATLWLLSGKAQAVSFKNIEFFKNIFNLF
jgi:hypothetical protein